MIFLIIMIYQKRINRIIINKIIIIINNRIKIKINNNNNNNNNHINKEITLR